MEKINLNINKLTRVRFAAWLSILFILIVANLFVMSGWSLNRFALALTGNYSKSAGQQLTIADWNNLPADFVAKSGDTMAGDLNLGGKKGTNVGAPTTPNDAVNKQYVDDSMVVSGGDTFVNWGQAACPSGTNLLYSGYAFANLFSEPGGSAEADCVQSGSPGGPTANPADTLYPLGTGEATALPTGIPAKKEIKCAVCYKSGGTCYERWGNTDCPGGNGFAPVYSGYSLGGSRNNASQAGRHCVDNTKFDSTAPDNNTWGAAWYGTTIWNNADIGLYTANSYLRCSVCCN